MTSRTALALVALLGTVVPVLGQSPPKDLHKVGDHWTAWNPPTSFPEGVEVYSIVPGDTLWDLSGRFLGDPYLWPQIWERNRYVLDAHWIYPGDPLLLGLEVAEPAPAVPAETTELEPESAPAEPVDSAESTETPEVTASKGAIEVGSPAYPFVQLGTADDIYCSGYIGDLHEDFPYRIAGSEYEYLKPSFNYQGVRAPIQARFGVAETVKYGLSLGDIVYLDRGASAGLAPGDLLTSVEPQQVIRHPVTGKPVGRFHAYNGRVMVLTVQDDTAIGEIVQSCDPIIIGSTLRPFVAEPVPSERKAPARPATDPPGRDVFADAATIVYAKDRLVAVGQDHVVFIDRGDDRNLVAGDILEVYRLPVKNAPPIILGEIAILSVYPHTAVAKVLSSRYPIYIGDIAISD